MLVFKSSGIVLKIHKVNEKDFLYTIFTQEYGKIICQKKISKSEKILDIGYIIQFEIETKEERKVHKMRNIKIISDFDPGNKSFGILQGYLEILAMIHKHAPEGIQIFGIIDILQIIHNYSNITEEKYILAKLKLMHIFGSLPDEHTDHTIQKILRFIHSQPIGEILRLGGLSQNIKKDLELLICVF